MLVNDSTVRQCVQSVTEYNNRIPHHRIDRMSQEQLWTIRQNLISLRLFSERVRSGSSMLLLQYSIYLLVVLEVANSAIS